MYVLYIYITVGGCAKALGGSKLSQPPPLKSLRYAKGSSPPFMFRHDYVTNFKATKKQKKGQK